MEITITKVKEDTGWLSCMSAYPINYHGIQFRTCEALFQYLRFQNYPDIQKEIIECKSPMGAKMKARKHGEKLNRGEKWDEAPEDIEWMKLCLKLKIEQYPELKEKLMKTGNAVIIEDCTTHNRESAKFWGAVKVNGKWEGENFLGKLWMELRQQQININRNTIEGVN